MKAASYLSETKNTCVGTNPKNKRLKILNYLAFNLSGKFSTNISVSKYVCILIHGPNNIDAEHLIMEQCWNIYF